MFWKNCYMIIFLPPTIWRMTEGYIFSLSTFQGGHPGLSKGKIFWHQIWLDTCSDWKKNFCRGTPTSKGKNFWHQIWLDTCSDWKKNFCQGTPPPVKGKIFDTRFGLIHVQTEKKKFVKGPPPPWNSKKLLWLCGGWYASCVHTGGLSCMGLSLWDYILQDLSVLWDYKWI